MSGGYPSALELCAGTSIGTNFGVTTTNGHNAWGSWLQVTASLASDCFTIGVSLYPTGNSSNKVAWQLGVGAAASEIVIIDAMLAFSNTGRSDSSHYLFPVSIPAGTRISSRSSGDITTDVNNGLVVQYFDSAFTMDGGYAGVDALGFNLTTTSGTTVTCGASANTKGSYAQLVASTARDYAGFKVVVTNGSSTDHILIDIAIGAAGSEIAIIPNLGLQCATSGGGIKHTDIFWIPIPAGTRVAARAAPNTTASLTFDLVLNAIYR